jgi:hypothetical protein
VTTPDESKRARKRVEEFLLFLAGHRDRYAGQVELLRPKMRIRLEIAREAHRLLRHYEP